MFCTSHNTFPSRFSMFWSYGNIKLHRCVFEYFHLPECVLIAFSTFCTAQDTFPSDFQCFALRIIRTLRDRQNLPRNRFPKLPFFRKSISKEISDFGSDCDFDFNFRFKLISTSISVFDLDLDFGFTIRLRFPIANFTEIDFEVGFADLWCLRIKTI